MEPCLMMDGKAVYILAHALAVSILRRIVMAKKTYLIIRLYMKEDADIDEVIMGTGESVVIAMKSANDDVIDAEIVGSSDEIIFDGDEGYEQTN